MNPLLNKRALVLAAAAFATAPAAWAVDFDDLDPTIYFGGESFDTGGYTFQVFDVAGHTGGLNGAIVGAHDSACLILSCPIGNDSNFYAGLNDGGINVSGSGATQLFQIGSFDAGFVAPVTAFEPDSVARIVLNGLIAATNTYRTVSFDLPGTQAGGTYSFSHFSLAGSVLDGLTLSGLSVNACLTTSFGTCLWPAGNQAQFALDNLAMVAVTPVPEPQTWALLGVGLSALLLARQRKRA